MADKLRLDRSTRRDDRDEDGVHLDDVYGNERILGEDARGSDCVLVYCDGGGHGHDCCELLLLVPA